MSTRIVVLVLAIVILRWVLRKEETRKKLSKRWQMIVVICGIVFVNAISWGDAMAMAGSRLFNLFLGTGTTPPQVQMVGGAQLRPELIPPTAVSIVTPTPAATPTAVVPRLEGGTTWFSAPTGGNPMGDVSGKTYRLVGRAGNPPLSGYAYMIEIEELKSVSGIAFPDIGSSGRGWVLLQSFPDDEQLKIQALALTVPDQTK